MSSSRRGGQEADAPVEEAAVDESRLLRPLCDVFVVASDPQLLQRDDIVPLADLACLLDSARSSLGAVRRGCDWRARVCDPVCDGVDALPALVCDEPQSPS